MSNYFLSFTYDVIKFNWLLFNLLIKLGHIFIRLLMMFGMHVSLLKTMRFAIRVSCDIIKNFPKVFHSYFSKGKF